MKTYSVIPNPTHKFVIVTDTARARFYADVIPAQSGMTHAEAARLLTKLQSAPVVAPSSYEPTEISSGLGIGGIGSDDYNITTETAPYVRPVYKCGGGQRWDERCDGCHRVTVVCNDCGLCERCHDK